MFSGHPISRFLSLARRDLVCVSSGISSVVAWLNRRRGRAGDRRETMPDFFVVGHSCIVIGAGQDL